jgi:hypothetical protein
MVKYVDTTSLKLHEEEKSIVLLVINRPGVAGAVL